MDAKIVFDHNGAPDIDFDENDLLEDNVLRTAVIVSLFTDCAADEDELEDNQQNRGYWGDSYPDVDGDKYGSKLWLLKRRKATDDVLADAQRYSAEALTWLIEDGLAKAVKTDAEWQGSRLAIRVTITLIDDSKFDEVFQVSDF